MIRTLIACIVFAVAANTASAQVLINEVMFDPAEIDGESGAEYIELINVGDSAVDLAAWHLYDATGRSITTLPNGLPRLQPGDLLVVAADSTILDRFTTLRYDSLLYIPERSGLGLNNDEDDVVLRDSEGATIDSLHYSDSWHRREIGSVRGMALERVSARSGTNEHENWATSAHASGGTPGRTNSVAIAPSVAHTELEIFPATVSPDGDGYQDHTRIAWRLPIRDARIVITVRDLDGHPIRHLAGNYPSAAEGEIIFDGRDDTGAALGVGVYVVVLEIYDQLSGHAARRQGLIVVARWVSDG